MPCGNNEIASMIPTAYSRPSQQIQSDQNQQNDRITTKLLYEISSLTHEQRVCNVRMYRLYVHMW